MEVRKITPSVIIGFTAISSQQVNGQDTIKTADKNKMARKDVNGKT